MPVNYLLSLRINFSAKTEVIVFILHLGFLRDLHKMGYVKVF